jgi:hypothetical protein
LLRAIGKGDAPSAKILLTQFNANPNGETENGHTPMVSAIRHKDPASVEVLINHGFNVAASKRGGGNQGSHAALEAVESKQPKILNLILSIGTLDEEGAEIKDAKPTVLVNDKTLGARIFVGLLATYQKSEAIQFFKQHKPELTLIDVTKALEFFPKGKNLVGDDVEMVKTLHGLEKDLRVAARPPSPSKAKGQTAEQSELNKPEKKPGGCLAAILNFRIGRQF